MNFRKLRKFKKNAKALSPVIATIILIAVTVAVSVVVAAWMGALTIGFMGNAEQASITNVVLSNISVSGTATEQAAVTVQNTGSATVTISSAFIDANTGTMNSATGGAAGTIITSFAINKGASGTFYVTFPGSFVSTASYTIKLMTAKGNTETTQATYSH
jgi:archaeal type IV pilus assembly protein PilA